MYTKGPRRENETTAESNLAPCREHEAEAQAGPGLKNALEGAQSCIVER